MLNLISRQWMITFLVIIFYNICVIKCSPLTIISNYPDLQNNEHLIQNDVTLTVATAPVTTTSRPSKLRQLLLQSLEPVETPSSLVVDVNCSSEVTLSISTRLCSCKNQLCFNNSGKISNKTRAIEKTCHDYCCNQKRNYRIKNVQKQINKCGVFNINNNPIFPWVVKLLLKRSESQICIGSLIHPRVVLTNVVCVFMQLNSQIKARLEDTSVSNSYEDRQIIDKIIHEGFSDSYEELGNNIALLILDRPFAATNKWSNIACLPQPDFIFDNKNCFISSWERDPLHNNKITPKTQPVAIHSLTKCQHEYRNSKSKYESHMHDGNICATSKMQQDINIKSSGAPIYCEIQHGTSNESHYVQIGILAWSTNVSRPPHIVTNVATYKNWIQKHLSHYDN